MTESNRRDLQTVVVYCHCRCATHEQNAVVVSGVMFAWCTVVPDVIRPMLKAVIAKFVGGTGLLSSQIWS